MGGLRASLPIGTVTFLLTDVVDSTSQWESNPAAMAAAMVRQRAVVRSAIDANAGVYPVEQGEGDSVVAVFATAGDAINAAIDAQRALRCAEWPEGIEMNVRMGIHSGEEVVQTEGSYQGPTIIRCARLRNLGHGGQVLVSSAAAALVMDGLPEGAALRDLGSHRLTGLRRPETVWQLLHPTLPDAFPPLADHEPARSRLPIALTSFVGRKHDLADLAARLGDYRIVTLVGGGGCGKTRMAIEYGRSFADEHQGGVWWADLTSARSDIEVIDAVARAIDADEEPGRPLADTVVSTLTLHSQPGLLIIDNCEHLISAVAELVDRAARHALDLSILATSREPLGVDGEAVVRVPSLDPTTAGAALFIERAAAAGHQVSGHAERELTVQICSRLDGIPLAIELAAARARSMPLERVASGLDDALRLLTGGPRTAIERQQTMQACVAWSVDHLDSIERTVLYRLAVFPSPFTLDAGAGVAKGDDIDEATATDCVGRLVDKNLVQFDASTARYRLLDVLRQYGEAQLTAADDLASARRSHGRWYCTWVHEIAPPGGRTDAAHFLIAEDHANVTAAIETALDADPALALETVGCLEVYFSIAERTTDAARWFVRLGDRGPGDHPLPWARAIGALVIDASWAGGCDEAALIAARDIAGQHGDTWAELLARFGLAAPASFAGDFDEIAAVADDAAAAGVEDVELLTRLHIGAIHNLLGQWKLVISELEPVIQRMRAIGWDRFADLPRAQCANALNRLGRSREAVALIEHVESRVPPIAVLVAEAYRTAGLQLVEPELFDDARAALKPSDWALVRGTEAMVVATEAIVHGDFGTGVTLLERAKPLHLMPVLQIGIDELLAPCLMTVGDLEVARAVVDRLDTLGPTFGSQSAPAAAAVLRAALAACTGQLDAGRLAGDAFELATAADNAAQTVDALELLAIASARAGDVGEAARIAAEAQRQRDATGYRWRWPHIERMHGDGTW